MAVRRLVRPCDDRDPNTINDVEDGNCNCVGEPIGSGSITLNCPADINVQVPEGTSSTIVSWNNATASTTCPDGGLVLTQKTGPASGSSFELGSTEISYEATDDCGNLETCSFMINVTEVGTPTDCDIESEFPWHEWISHVEFGDIDNSSDKSTYADYTNLSTEVAQGENYNITITNSFSYSTYDEYFSVWIDYNQDGLFSGNDELAFTANGNTPPIGTTSDQVSGSISIPNNALTGTTTMRILLRREDYADPCQDIDFGEVEDYTVIIMGSSAASSRAVLALSSEKIGRQSKLNWITNTEFKNDFFEVERSTDGIHFTAFAKLSSRKENTTLSRAYDWLDTQPLKGDNYYRVKQVFQDGTFEYTNVEVLNFNELIPLQLYPICSRIHLS